MSVAVNEVSTMEMDTILKEFVNVFEKCDDNTGRVPVATIIKHISSKVQASCQGGIEDLVCSILGRLDGVLTKSDFIQKVKEYLVSCSDGTGYKEMCMSDDTEYEQLLSTKRSVDRVESLTLREQLPDETQDEKDIIKTIENSSYALYNSSKDNNSIESETAFVCTMDRLFDEKSKLESLCNKLQIQIQSVEKTNTKLVLEKNQMSLSLEVIKGREKEFEQLFDEIQEEVKKKESRCVTLNRRLSEEKEALAKERQKSEELQEELRRKADCCAALSKRATAACRENEGLKYSIAELEKKVDVQEDRYNSCKKTLQICQEEILFCQSKIEALQKEKQAIEDEWLVGIEKFKEMSSSFKELQLENSMLKDTQRNKQESGCFSSLDLSLEDSFETISNMTKAIASPQFSEDGFQSRHYQDTSLSLKDEMEAEVCLNGEFNRDKLGYYNSSMSISSKSELENKIEEQERIIASLIEMVNREKEEHSQTCEILDECKRELSEREQKIRLLEKQNLEVSTSPKGKLQGRMHPYHGHSAEHSDQVIMSNLSFSLSDPGLVRKIEEQQTVIHRLVLKISEKFVKKSSSDPSVLMNSQNCGLNKFNNIIPRMCRYLILIFLLAATIGWILQWMIQNGRGRGQRPLGYYCIEEIMRPYLYFKWEKPPPI